MFVDWREGKTEDGRKGSKIEEVEKIKRQRGGFFFLMKEKRRQIEETVQRHIEGKEIQRTFLADSASQSGV